MDQFRLKPEQLRWTCDPESLGVPSTKEVEPCDHIIGQERAVRAIRLGLNIKSHGYNIYVSGLTGTGKTTTVKKLLRQMDSHGPTPGDICFVNNFTDPDQPRALVFQAGLGRKFAKCMDEMIRSLSTHIPQLYESEDYKARLKEILDRLQKETQAAFKKLESDIQKAGFSLVQIQAGMVTRPEIYPVIEQNVVPWQKIGEVVAAGKLTEDQVAEMREKHDQFMEELQEIANAHRELEKETQDVIQKLEQESAAPMIQAQIAKLMERYPSEKVALYLNEVKEDILNHLDRFKPSDEEADPRKPRIDEMFLYQVNVVVDNSRTQGTPIITEKSPTYGNLFGLVERAWDPRGMWRTDFTKIKAGSLLRANGGYLVLNLLEALAEPNVWKVLKRSLKNQQTVIQSQESMSNFAVSALKPEPVDINLKVVVIGDEATYRQVYQLDDEFKKIFKIRADFDTEMANDSEGLHEYAAFASKICRDEALLPLDKTALAAVMEYGVELAGRQKKITTRFSDIADIMREAHFWAQENSATKITVKHIDKATREKIYRSRRFEDKMQEMMEEGTLMIDTEGGRTGQVNGLSVYSLGDYSFGKPAKITAETAMGKAGVINIERESGLSGSSHNKGVLILSGYLRRMYAQDKPLTMSASLCFEQSYSGVDGDSASSTEIYALLSSLADIPLRQDIAVTGSVNQKGEIQPIGGVNEKIEGFFDLCQVRGLSGDQGVMIPAANVGDLMLRKDVVKAASQGKFHIWSVKTIDEGLEILTGMAAGSKEESGAFPTDSIHGRVDAKLKFYAEKMKEFASKN